MDAAGAASVKGSIQRGPISAAASTLCLAAINSRYFGRGKAIGALPQTAIRSHGLNTEEREQDHAQEHSPVPESRNLCLAVAAIRVSDRHLDDLQTKL
jgi:hypothetical protein